MCISCSFGLVRMGLRVQSARRTGNTPASSIPYAQDRASASGPLLLDHARRRTFSAGRALRRARSGSRAAGRARPEDWAWSSAYAHLAGCDDAPVHVTRCAIVSAASATLSLRNAGCGFGFQPTCAANARAHVARLVGGHTAVHAYPEPRRRLRAITLSSGDARCSRG
jgi:hypothetical protein